MVEKLHWLDFAPREAYLEVAELVLTETSREEFLGVAAGLAVLSGIAAADSICCARLQRRHRGDDHRNASLLLESATPDGRSLAAILTRLLDAKDEAHYGIILVSASKARNTARWARTLVTRARDEYERQ